MINAYKNFFKGYVDFSGRSTRSEYWWIYLTNLILAVFLYMITYSTVVANPNSIEAIETVNSLTYFSIFLIIIFFLPGLALIIRRLRDADFYRFHSWGRLNCTPYFVSFSKQEYCRIRC